MTLRGAVAEMMDMDIVEYKTEHQSYYDVQFRTNNIEENRNSQTTPCYR